MRICEFRVRNTEKGCGWGCRRADAVLLNWGQGCRGGGVLMMMPAPLFDAPSLSVEGPRQNVSNRKTTFKNAGAPPFSVPLGLEFLGLCGGPLEAVPLGGVCKRSRGGCWECRSGSGQLALRQVCSGPSWMPDRECANARRPKLRAKTSDTADPKLRPSKHQF